MDRTLKAIEYLLAVHVLGLLLMTLCRGVLLFSNLPMEGIEWSRAAKAMLIGVKFDNLIGSYIAALPCIILPVVALLCGNGINRIAAKTASCYFGLLYSVVIFIEVANARYFHFFENHFTIGITEWFGFVGDTAGMVMGDATNWIFLAIAIVLIALYIPALKAITRNYLSRLK
jgi:hypothetical protein